MYIVILVSSVLVSAALSMPTHGKTLAVDLATAMDKTICPISVHIDEVEHRIPRRIKTLTCAATPNPICHKEGMAHACCRSRHHTFHTQCVQVTDNVMVRYTNRGDDQQLHAIPVPVGCACMIREETPAREDR